MDQANLGAANRKRNVGEVVRCKGPSELHQSEARAASIVRAPFAP
eukprot:CAMPEP_0181521936 /NCGR_PEP_ID=MMETSP1110-20121109/67105_1 /TAXON_ID=174948 /ORGANISM="Symbiodinium sp., Strain CCMP421" /LENGTH=44 /DNA_ID= /DNA_START= /DNA_END= /DNA_ORIENTATION=